MLACARIGAPHSVVFGGFSAEALRDRINDAGAKLVVTADGGYRRGAAYPLKPAVDEALEGVACVQKVICVRRTGSQVRMREGRDVWWDDAMREVSADCPPAKLDSEHPLFILYTSGTTGKPKGVLHTTGGYLTHVATTAKAIFDLKEEDTYWCTADLGWVTGHSYVVYGILANGATTLMYEGVPTHPRPDRFWEMIERHRVTIFYTAPTAIRTFMRLGDEHPKRHDLSSLRLLGTVGEPINPEAWIWYHRVIGGKRCPIVDTWWQTETGGIMITPLPAGVPTKPGSATLPFPGIDAAVYGDDGKHAARSHGGFLVLRRPWPGMLRGIWGDPERYQQQYWSRFEGIYFAGDGAHRDKDGYFWIVGRIDDVMNVAGHRIGTMEIESALVSTREGRGGRGGRTAGRPHRDRPSSPSSPRSRAHPSAARSRRICAPTWRTQIGGIAKPADIRFTDALPKTRSGKIMRRLLRDVASGSKTVGDTTTLEDFSVIAKLQEQQEEA